MNPPARRQLLALGGRAGQDDGLHVAQAIEQPGEDVVLEAVVERDVGRGADDGQRLVGVQAELVEHGAVGLEVGQVVLLLQPLVAAQGGVRGAVAGRAARAGSPPGTTTARARRQLTVCWTLAHS